MARIDLRQLDDFSKTLLEDIVNGQGIRWDSVNNEFVPYTFYGSGFLNQKQLTPTTTSSTTFVTHQTFTTPVLPAGIYSIAWNVIWGTNNANSPIEVQVEENNVNLAPTNFVQVTNRQEVRGYVSYVTQFELLTSRAMVLTVKLRRLGNNNDVTVYGSEFTVFASSEI